MDENINRHLITRFAEAFDAAAPELLGVPATLKLLALRDVAGEEMSGALAVAATWSAAFAVPCGGALAGLVVCLFKAEEGATLDRLIASPQADGLPLPGARALVAHAFRQTVTAFEAAGDPAPGFGAVRYLDLSLSERSLAGIVGDSASVGTFALTVGEEIDSQALLLYAPNGSLDTAETSREAVASAMPPAAAEANALNPTSAAAPASAPRRAPGVPKREESPRNIERLLDVELNVVVRFGVTHVPLREVVRMGAGSMIELNRAVDEPVELLVNNRPFARGEVVVVDGYYGVRITEIGAPNERALSLHVKE